MKKTLETQQLVVSPTVTQSDADRLQNRIENNILLEGRISGCTGVPNLIDEQPAVSHDPFDVSQECIPPKVEPSDVEVEEVLEEDDDEISLLCWIGTNQDSDTDSNDDDDDEVTPTAEGSCINSHGLRRTNRERTPPTYTKVTRETTGQR